MIFVILGIILVLTLAIGWFVWLPAWIISFIDLVLIIVLAITMAAKVI